MKAMNLATAMALVVGVAGQDQAAPVILTGNYLQVSISDYGTFGRNGGETPAFLHDPTGKGAFDPSTDYIAPGDPHDGFSIVSNEFSWRQNDNNGSSDFGFASPTLLTGAEARGFSSAVKWTGMLEGYLSVTNSYFFNADDQRVLIETSVTALRDLSGLALARSVDPDSGTFDSKNQRGNVSLGVDDFVGSESMANGRTLALVNVDAAGFRHTTSIQGPCCSNQDPQAILTHTGSDQGVSSTGDDSLNIAYAIGALHSGASAIVRYSYNAGMGLDLIANPTAAVPEPATWVMMIAGFSLAGIALRRRRGRRTPRLAMA